MHFIPILMNSNIEAVPRLACQTLPIDSILKSVAKDSNKHNSKNAS